MLGVKMGRYRSGAIALATMFVVGISPVAVSAQSLTDALISAYRNSQQLKSDRAALRATDEGVAAVIAGKRPSLTASYSTGATYFASTSATTYAASLTLSSQLTLWDGGDTALRADLARKQVDIGRQNLVLAEQTVLLDAVTAFMDMRRDFQFLQLSDNNRSVIAQQVQATRDRFEVGEVRRTDVSQAEARLAAGQSIVALRQGTLEISREGYHAATGTYPDILQAPPILPRFPASLEAAKSIALRGHPSVLIAQHAAEIADLNIGRAEAAMKPTLALSGSVGINANAATGDTANITLGGTAPIYQGGRLTSAMRSAIALRDQSRSDIQLAGIRISLGVTRSWSQIQIARASIVARQKEVRSSRVALRGIREEVSLGARTTLDVLDAEQDLLEAETNLVSAKRDEYVAVYSLLSAMGLLTVKHLGLGIKTYDATENYRKVQTAPGPSDRGKLLKKIFERAGKK